MNELNELINEFNYLLTYLINQLINKFTYLFIYNSLIY